jgi:multidrug efflux pump
VISVIEQEMNGSPGLIYLESTSQANGTGSIVLTYESGTDPNFAQVDVQNRLSRAAPRLPAAVTQQGVRVDKARSNFLLFTILSSDNPAYDPIALGDYASRNVLPEIQRISGVGQAQLFGTERAMRIWIDPAKLVGFNLSANDVNNAIRTQNAQVSAGTLGDLPIAANQPISATVVVAGQLTTVEQFGDIVLRANTDGSTVRMKDVARIELGGQSYGTSARLNGKPSTGIGVQLSPTGNALATATAIHARMAELARYFPPGVKYDIPYDSSRFVRISIRQVVETLVEAVILVFLVMYLFLQNLRYTLIPTIVVPVSLLGAFSVMWVFGYSINVLTMFAMVLAVGILVDDAIVVIENVERIMSEEGLHPRDATKKAMEQITAALIGISVTLVSVFLPMAFFSGSIGNIYRQFSLVMVSAMLCSVFPRAVADACPVRELPEAGRGGAQAGQAGLLRLVQPRLQGDDACLRRLGREDPAPDRGDARRLRGDRRRRVLHVHAHAGVVPADRGPGLPDRQRPAAAGRDADANARRDAAGRAVLPEPARGRQDGERARLLVLGPGPERGARVRAAQALGRAQGSAALGAGARGARVRGARERSRRVHLRPRSAGDPRARHRDRLRVSAPGPWRQRPRRARRGAQPVARHGGAEQGARGGAPRRPRGRAAAADRHRPRPRQRARCLVRRDQHRALDRARLGVRQRLPERRPAAARRRPGRRPRPHADRRPAPAQRPQQPGQARADVGDGDDALDHRPDPDDPLQRLSDDADLGRRRARLLDRRGDERDGAPREPAAAGFAYEWTGQSREERLSGSTATILLAFSMLAVFLCLSALYESWSIPFAVLLAVPLGVLGAVIGATLRGMENDVFFKVGLITVIGLSAKNAILIIEFAKDLVAEGKDLIEATLQAVHLRFRPILMTSIAFILGVLPLVVATGAGSASQRAIGTGVMGGMITATLLAIFFVPVFFVVVRRIFKGRLHATAGAASIASSSSHTVSEEPGHA